MSAASPPPPGDGPAGSQCGLEDAPSRGALTFKFPSSAAPLSRPPEPFGAGGAQRSRPPQTAPTLQRAPRGTRRSPTRGPRNPFNDPVFALGTSAGKGVPPRTIRPSRSVPGLHDVPLREALTLQAPGRGLLPRPGATGAPRRPRSQERRMQPATATAWEALRERSARQRRASRQVDSYTPPSPR